MFIEGQKVLVSTCSSWTTVRQISVIILFLIISIELFAQNSDYANTGNGNHIDKVLWLTWGGTDLDDGIHDGDSVRFNMPLGGTLDVVFSNVSIAYPITDPTPGDGETPEGYLPWDVKTWCGATLYQAYDLSGSTSEVLFSNFDSLGVRGNGENGQDINFDVTFTMIINGMDIPVDIVTGDPETTNPLFPEILTFTTNVGNWRLIENIKGSTYGLTGTGSSIAVISDTETGVACAADTSSGTNSSPLLLSKGMVDSITTLNVDVSFPNGDGHQALIFGVQLPFDQSDAPASYGVASHFQEMDTVSTGGPDLENLSSLYLGSTKGDADYHTNNPLYSADAAGDDTDDVDDEDGLSVFNFQRFCSGDSLTIPKENITVANTTGDTAYLHAWIDFDDNGTFDTNEYLSVDVLNGASSPDADLLFTVPSDVVVDTTILRLRLTSDTSITSAKPSGIALDGEVEDHQIIITGAFSCPSTESCYIIADGQDMDTLYSINPSNGTKVNIGATNTYNIESMAIDPVSGIMYAANNDSIGTINIATGAFSHIYRIGSIDGALGSLSVSDIDGLTYDQINGILWASNRRGANMDGDDDYIFQIDPATGQPILDAFGVGIDYLIIDTPEDDLDDLAMHSDGTLFAISNDGGTGNQRLITINKTTGAFTTIGDYNIEDVEGLTFSATDQLLATVGDGGSSEDQFFSIDPATAESSFIASLRPATDVEACVCQNASYTDGVIGDLIWADLNSNGLKDIGEPGVNKVRVNLLNAGSVLIDSVNTAFDGTYHFNQLDSGTYIIEVQLPSGASYAAMDVAANDTIDSDVDIITGKTDPIVLALAEINYNVDAGLINADVTVRDCTDDGDLLVADETGYVLRFDSGTGTMLDTFIGGLVSPMEIEIGPDDYLYIVDDHYSQIRRFSAVTGALIDVFASGLNNPNGLTIRGDSVYVNNRSDDEVKEYSILTGNLIGDFVTTGSGGVDGNFGGLEFGPDGNLYVSSRYTNEIIRYNGTTGAYIDVFVSAGSGGLNEPRDLKFGPDGNLYVSSGFTDDIKRYNGSTGAFIDIFVSSGSGGLNNPYHFIFRSDNRLYVSAESSMAEVYRYDDSTGAFIDIFTSGLTGPRGFIFAPVPGCEICNTALTNPHVMYFKK